MPSKHKCIPILLYIIVWILCVCFFWLFVHGDAFGYGVLVFFLLLPLAALVSSLLMGLYKGWKKRTWLFPLVPSAGHVLADYVTFKLANTLATYNLNTPDWSLVLPGLVYGLIGMIIGRIISRRLHNRISANHTT